MKKLLLLLTIISHFAFGQGNAPLHPTGSNETIQYTFVVPKAKVWGATDTSTGKSPIFRIYTPRIKIPNVNTTTDTSKFDFILVGKGDSLLRVSKKLVGTGGSLIDTLKEYRIAQGRGSTPFILYFNGVAWVKNDTSYQIKIDSNRVLNLGTITGSSNDYISSIPETAYRSSNIYIFNPNFNSTNTTTLRIGSIGILPINEFDGTVLVNKRDVVTTNTYSLLNKGTYWLVIGAVYQAKPIIQTTSFTAENDNVYRVTGSAIVTDPSSVSGKGYTTLVVNGTTTIGGVGYSMAGTVIERIFYSGSWNSYVYASGGGTLTSVYSANSDIAVDSSITGKRKLTLNSGSGANQIVKRDGSGNIVGYIPTALTSGYINIGDGTNTAFPRLPSGDWTISNLGVNTLATVNSNVGTFGGAAKTLTATVNAKGLVTAISEQNIAIAESQVTNLTTDLSTLTSNVATNTSNIALKATIASPTFTGTVTIPSGSVMNTPASIGLANATGLPLTTGVTGILAGTNGGTGVNNGAKTITVSGNTSIGSSTNTVTFTTTGNTSVTFPTTGTLATVAGTEVPLTFSTGLTRTTNTITNNLSTGVSGGQTLIGSTSTTSGITYRSTSGVGTTGADHIFQVGSNGGTEAMRILNSGFVGIGTNIPVCKLEIYAGALGSSLNDVLTMQTLRVADANQINLNIFRYRKTAGSSWFNGATRIQTAVDMVNQGSFIEFDNGSLRFGALPIANNFFYSIPERLTIYENGNIGIGVATPTTGRLQISAGSASVAGLQLTNQTAYTSGVAGSVSLENTNDFSFVGNIVSKRGATANFGTSDSQTLNLVTGNTARVTIGSTGVVTLTAGLIGIASQSVFNTVSTTISAFGAATTATIFGTATTSATYSIGNNVTATGNTKAIDIGTLAASGSTTNITLGSAVSGATSNINVNGNLALTSAGNKLSVKTGTNASIGTATLVAGTVTVNTTAVTANSAIFVTILTKGTITLPVAYDAQTRTAGTSFTITSANITDTSIVQWWIVEPN